MPTCIIENKLYLGDYNDACNIDSLSELNIGCLINVTKECNYTPHDGIIMHKIELIDNINNTIYDKLETVLSLIKSNLDNNINVLVHCYMGRSRSASFIIAYLMKHKNMTLIDAYEHIAIKRNICPNAKFMEDLVKYETDLYGKTTFFLDRFKIGYLCRYLKMCRSIVSNIYRKNNGDLQLTINILNNIKKKNQ